MVICKEFLKEVTDIVGFARLVSFNFDEMIKMRERWMERSES